MFCTVNITFLISHLGKTNGGNLIHYHNQNTKHNKCENKNYQRGAWWVAEKIPYTPNISDYRASVSAEKSRKRKM